MSIPFYTVQQRGNVFHITSVAQRVLRKVEAIERTPEAAQSVADRLNRQRARISAKIERDYQRAMTNNA